jgi:hypothetical protein
MVVKSMAQANDQTFFIYLTIAIPTESFTMRDFRQSVSQV